MTKSAQPGLIRSLGTLDLVAVLINAIIGAGIFGLPAKVFGLIGDFSLLAFLVCAIFAASIVICFAEVGSRFRETGGPYLYAREAFGPLIGFEAGWLMWLARVSAFAANSNLLIGYVAYFVPGIASGFGRNLFLSLLTLALVAINIVGVRNATRVNNFFTIGKLVPILLFVLAGLWFADWGRFSFAAAPDPGRFSSSVLLLVYAFTGFEMGVIPSGEIRDPRRTIPVALLSAIAIVAAIYLLIQVVCIGTLPDLANSQRPLADAANRFLGSFGAIGISVGIIISIVGNLHITILSASRIPFAMGERRELPQLLAATHPTFHTPHYAILFTGAVMLTLALSGTFIYALTISTLARLTIYITTAAALPVLRRKPNVPEPLLKIPYGPAIAAAAILLAAWLLTNSTVREARDTAIAAAAGLILYASAKPTPRTP